jgi:hypothetical protein
MSHVIEKGHWQKEQNIIPIEREYIIFQIKPMGTVAAALVPPFDVAIIHFQVHVCSTLSSNLGLF